METNDVLMILAILRGLSEEARDYLALLMTMNTEGRTKLTPDEVALIKAKRAVARADLEASIERAEAAGR